MPEDKKVYLHIKTVEKKPTLTTKTKVIASSLSTRFQNLIKKSKERLSQKRKHFSAVKPGLRSTNRGASSFAALRKSFKELRRNFLRSIGTIFIIALVLITIGTAIIVSFITEEAINIVDAKLDVSIEVQDNASLDKVQELIRELEILPAIRSVVYISKAEALEKFRQEHAELTEFLQTYNISNPLPATLRISVTDPKRYPEVINFLDNRDNSSVIDMNKARANFDERDRIQQLISITDTIKYFLYFFISVFIGIGILIIVATMQLTLQQRRRELSIMQVVGASFKRILSPFILESSLLSILSTILASVILVLIAAKLSPLATTYFDSQSVNILRFLQINILPFTLILLGSALSISVIVTLLTTWRYLRSQKLF